MKDKIIGGAIAIVIGGSGFALSQSDIVNNFASETGMTTEQAREYVEDSQDDLDSFANIGKTFVEDGNSIISDAATIDCANYQYEWESTFLTCDDGKQQLQDIGAHHIALGNCYQALDTDLGDQAKPKMRECIGHIDQVNSDYDLPIMKANASASDITESKTTNSYNKSILKTALESE